MSVSMTRRDDPATEQASAAGSRRSLPTAAWPHETKPDQTPCHVGGTSMTTTSVREVPTAPGGVPMLGHALEMKRRPGDFLLSLQPGEPVTRIRLGRAAMYVVNRPDLIREVLRRPETFARGGAVLDRYRQMFGNGLGISEG